MKKKDKISGKDCFGGNISNEDYGVQNILMISVVWYWSSKKTLSTEFLHSLALFCFTLEGGFVLHLS